MRTVNIFCVSLLFFTMVFLSGCGKESPAIMVCCKNVLVQTVYADWEGAYTIGLVTTGAWTSTVNSPDGSSVNWLSLDPDHGDKAGEYCVKPKIEVNTTGKDRKANITFSCKGELINATLTQKATTYDGEVPLP